MSLITNVGREHLEFFGTVEGVAAEETALWAKVPGGKEPVAFVNTDDELLMRAARGRKKTVRYGTTIAQCGCPRIAHRTHAGRRSAVPSLQ